MSEVQENALHRRGVRGLEEGERLEDFEMSIFNFFYTLKTNQIVRLHNKNKTIEGNAFRVFNSCLDLKIENCTISEICIKDNKIYVFSE